MELNKSSLVPFQVNDPISGEDITNNIRLTAIEQGGVPSPYLKPNGDSTFTVIAADKEDVTEATTFKLEVDYGGLPYELEASTDITVSGTTAGQFKVKVIEPASLAQVVEQNVEFYYDYQATYKGVYLGDGECQASIPVPGITPVDGVTLLREEVLADGITHRVWFKASLRTGNLVGLVVNIRRLPLVTPGVSDTDYVYVTLRLKVIAAGSTELSIVMHDWYSVNIQGVVGAEMISFFELYQGKTKLSLLDPTLSYTITDSGNMATPYNRLSFVTISEGIRWTIKNIPSSSSIPPMGNITLTVKKGSLQADVRLSVSVYSGSNNMYQTKFLIGPEANKKKNSVIEIGDYVSDMPYPWFAPANGVFESGTLTLKDIKNNVITQTVDVKGMSVNSINRFIVEQTASWMGQQAYFGPAVLKCPYTDKRMPEFYYVPVPMSHSTFTVPEAPYVFTTNTKTVNGNAGANSAVLISCKQDRGNGLELIRGDFAMVYVEGAAASTSGTNLRNGQMSQQLAARGSEGDVRIYGKFTPTGGTEMDFSVIVQASFANKITTTEKTVQVKVFDVLNTPPFDVYNDGVLINDQIRNVRLIKNGQYFSPLPDDPNSWEVVDGRTTETLIPQYFTYEAKVNGIWETLTARGNYNVAAYDGIAFKVTVDYGRGVGVTTEIPVSRNNTNRFTVWPVYRGKPLANGFSGTVQVGTLFTVPIAIVGPADDGVGVVIEYTAPDTFGSGNNACVLTLTIDDTPGTTVNVNKWVGNFTGIYVNKGLSVLPITLVPSTQVYARPLSWDAKIYYGGVLLKPNDPRLSMEVSNASAVTPPIFDIVGIEDRYVWFAFNRKPDAAASFTNRIMVTYNDGVNPPEISGYVNIQASYSMTNLVPVTLKALKEPLGNTENIIPVEFQRSGYNIAKPTTVLSFSGRDDPASGNALLGEIELIDAPDDIYRKALKFKSGWTGGKVIVNMVATFPDLADNWVLRDNELIIPPATITVGGADRVINGITNASKVLTFTLSQERLINDVVEHYTFSDATISDTITVTGAIQKVDTISNSDGTFTATFYGKGETGAGSATFTVTDGDGYEYQVTLDVTAEIDSSGFVLTLSPDSASGKKGDRITFTGTLTIDGNNRRLDDAGLTWSVEPTGYMTLGMRNSEDVRFDVAMTTTEDINEVVTLKVTDRDGRFAIHEIDLTVKPNMFVKLTQMDVKVWDKSSKTPFQVVDSSDIPQGLYDVELVDNENMINVSPRPTYQIVAEAAQPAKVVMSTWHYRFSTDPSGFKRTVEVPFNIAAYDGSPYTFKIEGTTIFTLGSQAWFNIVPLYKGDTIVKMVRWSGYGDGPRYVSMISTTEFNTKLQITAKSSNIVTAFGIQNFRIRIDGGVEGNPTGEFEVPVELTVYSTAAPFQLTEPVPKEITGKFGDVFTIHTRGNYAGIQRDLTTHDWEGCTPSDVIELVPGSVTKDSFDVRFVRDITENAKTTNVQFGFSGIWSKKEIATAILNVTQKTLHPKLTPAPGFQSSGQGDVDNPVTLTQSVLNPE